MCIQFLLNQVNLIRNEREYNKMNLKLLGLLEKGLVDSERPIKIDPNKFKNLKELFDFRANNMETIPNIIHTIFPEKSDLTNKLKDYLRNGKYDQFFKSIRSSSNFILFNNNPNLKYEDLDEAFEKVILAKTFNICPSSSTNDLYQQQIYDIKHL